MRRVSSALFSLLLAGLVFAPFGGSPTAPLTGDTGGAVVMMSPGSTGCCRQ